MNDNKPPVDWSDRLVGFGAGLSSALLFAASTKGSGLGMLLAYVCILPLLIGALGFSTLAAGIGAAAGAGFLGWAGEPLLGLAFFLGFGLPGLSLGGLARWTYRLRASDLSDAPQDSPETLPADILPYHLSPGSLLALAALLASLAACALAGGLIWSEGGYSQALASALREYGPSIDEALRGVQKIAPDLNLERARKIVVLVFPAAMAGSQTLLLAFNLWLAARAVDISGRLDRMWPPLPEMLVLPRPVVAGFVAALGLCLLGAPTAVFAGVFVAAAGVALALQGLAALHALTRDNPARGGILTALYALVVVALAAAPPLLALLSLFGLFESVFTLRARRARAKIQKRSLKTGE